MRNIQNDNELKQPITLGEYKRQRQTGRLFKILFWLAVAGVLVAPLVKYFLSYGG